MSLSGSPGPELKSPRIGKSIKSKREITAIKVGKCFNFREISPELSIIRGNYSINDVRFKIMSRGKQATAACAVAIVLSNLIESKDWSTAFVNQVLENGDKLYRISHARVKLKDDEYMATSLLHPEFFVGDYKCQVLTEAGVVFGSLQTKTTSSPSLDEGVRDFLRTPNHGILTLEKHSCAIWTRQQEPNVFYCFDPGSCNEQGRRSSEGAAVVLRATNLATLQEHLRNNFPSDPDARYCIDKVTLLKVKPVSRVSRGGCATSLQVDKKVLDAFCDEDSKSPRKPLEFPQPCKGNELQADDGQLQKTPFTIEISNFAVESRFANEPLVDQSIDDDQLTYDSIRVNVPANFKEMPLPGGSSMLVLHGWKHKLSEEFSAKGEQSSASCIAAFGMIKVHPVRTWLRTTLDEILTIGDKLYVDVKNYSSSNVKSMTASDLYDARFEISGRKMVADVEWLSVAGIVLSKVPKVLSLAKGIDEFFQKYVRGVLDCGSLCIAIWKQDDYYYQFDSAACDAYGFHTEDKGKVEPNQLKSDKGLERQFKGKCCVIRFPRVQFLINHLLKNLGSSRYNDRFVIRRVEILDDVPGIRDWNSFRPGEAGKSWILRGNINSEDDMFTDENRGKQDLPIAVCALVGTSRLAPAEWFKEAIDTAIIQGDKYYSWTLPKVEDDEFEDPESSFLYIKNLKRLFFWKNCKVEIDLEETRVGGALTPKEMMDLPSLSQAMGRFFQNCQYGIFECRGRYFPIWCQEEERRDKSKEMAYYTLHPNARDTFMKRFSQSADGRQEPVGCVLRFVVLNDLTEILEYECSDSQESDDFFSIHVLFILSVGDPLSADEIKKIKSSYNKPKLLNYTQLGETGAILSGSINQANEILFKKETRDKQQAANALVTLGMTTLFNPHEWSLEMIDDILKMGDNLCLTNIKNLPPYDSQENPYPREYLLPSEFDTEFHIGVNKINLDIEEESMACKIEHLAKKIEEFFGKNKMGILRREMFMIALWSQGEVYFTLDPHGKKNGTAMVYWFTDFQQMANEIRELAGESDDRLVIDTININNLVHESNVPEEENMETDERWYDFLKVNEGVWSIECILTMNDPRFAYDNRGKQATAICTMAIVFSKVYEAKKWSSEVLDEVTVAGDKLHSRSADRLGWNRNFLPKDLISEFFVANRRINLQMNDCLESGSLGGNGSKVQNILDGLSNFFERNSAGCLTLEGSQNFAIWKESDFFYLLDPGVTLMRFESIELLAEHLLSLGEAKSDFEITSVNVIDWNKLPPWKFDPSPAVRPSNLPPFNAYEKLPEPARAILRGSTHEHSELFADEVRGHQTASNCMAALGMSLLKSSVSWTKPVLDEILVVGNTLHRESFKLPENANKTILKPADVLRVFQIGINVLSGDVEEATVSGLVSLRPPEPEPKKKGNNKKEKKAPAKKPEVENEILLEQGVTQFFEKNHAGILSVRRYMVALWRHEGVFFIYDPKPCDARGHRELPKAEGAAAAVSWYACLEPLVSIILANIPKTEQFDRFEISRVIVKTILFKPLPKPAPFKPVNKNGEDSDCPGDCGIPIRVSRQSDQPGQQSLALEKELVELGNGVGLVSQGTVNLFSSCFDCENRGLQSTAIAAVAIVVANVHQPPSWTRELVDAILENGDGFHRECARHFRTGPRNLSPSELLRVFVVGDARATLRLTRNVTAGICLEQDLRASLELFFRENREGILHTATIAVAILLYAGKFYLFEPTGRYASPAGNQGKCEAPAALLKFDGVASLARTFVEIARFREPTVYTLNAVQVIDLRYYSK